MRHQAQLICANAYDHLVTLGRSLGGDGAMSLYAHSSLSRVVCEAAVRLTWFLDPVAKSEERIMRGAASLLMSADEQLRGLTRFPEGYFHPDIFRPMVDNCTAERDAIHKLFADAGLSMVMSKDGKKVARLSLNSPAVSVPLHLDITEKMSQWLPDSPTWYNLSSGVTHSFYWMLRDAVAPVQDEADLALEPNLMQVAAAGQCAISGSRLITETIADYYGHDPQAAGAPSRARRDSLDPYMERLAAKQALTFRYTE